MTVQISSPHCPMTEAMRTHAMDAVKKLHTQHPPKIEDPMVRIVLEPHGHHQEASCAVHYADKHETYDVIRRNADLYCSIDQAFHALAKSIQNHRDKHIDQRHHRGV